MGQAKVIVGILLAAAVIIASFALFTVDEREKAVMFRLGEIVKTDFKPGLHWQTWFVQSTD